MATSDRCYLVAAAIHIGENRSSCALSFRNDVGKVSIPNWQNPYGSPMEKVPTCVLFTKDKKFRAFGFDAEEQYSNLVREDKQGDYYFFRRFKMQMFEQQNSTKQILMKDETGKKLPAIDVIAACIKYLSDHVLDVLRIVISDISSTDIRWVLTFPASQNMLYKHFRQTAAIKAGINDDHLIIVSEPEAASLSFHYHLLHDSKKADNYVLFVPKAKYLILDAGGDSVDITVYEVQENNSLKQIYTARYEDCGGTYIDKAFLSLLADMLGSNVMEKFKTAQMEDYQDLLREFETKKHNINNTMSGRFLFKVPCSLYEDFEQMNGISIAEHIKTKPHYKERVIFRGDKLRIDANLVKDLYNGASEIIIGHLKQIFEKDLFMEIATILMVGGFSKSPILQLVIKNTFRDKKIVVPDKPEFAILKGALGLGHNPSMISMSHNHPVINMSVLSGYATTRLSEK